MSTFLSLFITNSSNVFATMTLTGPLFFFGLGADLNLGGILPKKIQLIQVSIAQRLASAKKLCLPISFLLPSFR